MAVGVPLALLFLACTCLAYCLVWPRILVRANVNQLSSEEAKEEEDSVTLFSDFGSGGAAGKATPGPVPHASAAAKKAYEELEQRRQRKLQRQQSRRAADNSSNGVRAGSAPPRRVVGPLHAWAKNFHAQTVMLEAPAGQRLMASKAAAAAARREAKFEASSYPGGSLSSSSSAAAAAAAAHSKKAGGSRKKGGSSNSHRKNPLTSSLGLPLGSPLDRDEVNIDSYLDDFGAEMLDPHEVSSNSNSGAGKSVAPTGASAAHQSPSERLAALEEMAATMARHHDQLAFTLAATSERRSAQQADLNRLAVLAHQPELAALRQQINQPSTATTTRSRGSAGGGVGDVIEQGPWAGLDEFQPMRAPPSSGASTMMMPENSRLNARLNGQQQQLRQQLQQGPPARKLSKSERRALGEFADLSAADAMGALQTAPTTNSNAEAARAEERQRVQKETLAAEDITGGFLTSLFGVESTPSTSVATKTTPSGNSARPSPGSPNHGPGRQLLPRSPTGSRGPSLGGERAVNASSFSSSPSGLLVEVATGDLSDLFSSSVSAVSQMSKQVSEGLQDTFKVPEDDMDGDLKYRL